MFTLYFITKIFKSKGFLKKNSLCGRSAKHVCVEVLCSNAVHNAVMPCITATEGLPPVILSAASAAGRISIFASSAG